MGCWETSHPVGDVQAKCCGDPLCKGFSYHPANGQGCCKATLDGPFSLAGIQGFVKQGGPPPPPCSQVHATTWSKYGSHAVVAVAAWCPGSVNVTLAVDWDALGLSAGTAVASLPDIPGVQEGAALPGGPSGPFQLPVDGGLLMLIAAPGFAPA